MVGRVVSVKMQHTATVLVEGKKTHALYKKSFVSSKKFLADDPLGVNLGDVVEIIKIKPISKKKHWQITKVIGKDVIAMGEEHMKEKAQEAIEEAVPAGRQVMPEEEESTVDSLQTTAKKQAEVESPPAGRTGQKTEDKKEKVVKETRVKKEKK